MPCPILDDAAKLFHDDRERRNDMIFHDSVNEDMPSSPMPEPRRPEERNDKDYFHDDRVPRHRKCAEFSILCFV